MSDPTFHPAFALGVREQLTRTAALTPGTVTPEPRVLVPVDIQALVVRPADADTGAPADVVPAADIASRVLDPIEPNPGEEFPPPFSAAPDREPGVHLHWAMPDGLTTTRPDGQHRPLPDRWLVTRLGDGTPRAVTSWIVEADRASVTRLDAWSEPAPLAAQEPRPYVPPDALTAVTDGDPTWAAVYGNVRSRFGFHDPWPIGGAPRGPLTYVVVGWYTRSELDPPANDGDVGEVLAGLGWTLDPERLAATRRQRAEQTRTLAQLGLVPAKALEPPATVNLDGLTDPGSTVQTEPDEWWPRRTIYHGVVYGVLYHVRPADPLPDPKPDPADVDIAVGSTSVDASATLVSARVAGLGDPAATAAAEVQHAAFAYSMTDALSAPTGVARIAEELHARAFDAAAGGQTTQKVLAGDPFETIRDPVTPAPATAELASRNPAGTPGRVRLAFAGSGSDVADLLAIRTRPARITPPPEPRRVDEQTVALPRFFAPQDPVVIFGNMRRSLRHGYDGRFEPDDRLRCRLSGETVATLAGVDGRVLIASVPTHGAIPPDAGALVVEAAIEDPFVEYDEQAAGILGLPMSVVQRAFQAERRLFVHWLSRPSEVSPLMRFSLKDGVSSSPAGITIWRQPWVPLLMEWEVDADLAEMPQSVQLRELDLEAPPGSLTSRRIAGRCLLTPGTTKALDDAIAAFADAEDVLDREGKGVLDEATEAALRRLTDSSAYTDFLAGSLADLRHRLLGFADQITRDDEPPVPHDDPLLTRTGRLTIRRLRVVDTFGRYLTLIDDPAPASGNRQVLVGRGLRAEATPQQAAGKITLAPRVNQPARLLLRLVTAADDAIEAAVDQSRPDPPSPIGGWLLADHADDAVEFFDPSGDSLGQLRHDPLTGSVVWEGPPGDRGPLGARPAWDEPALRHLSALATGLLDCDAAEREAGVQRSDTPLQALMRVVDTTAQSIGGGTRNEHLAQLVGRPVAVVRATMRLEIAAETPYPALTAEQQAARAAAWRRLAATAFPIRLGALTRVDDGLYTYIVDDDYTRLWTAAPSVAAEAADSGRQRGDLGPLPEPGTTPAAAVRPIDAPMIAAGDSTIWLRPGQTLRLTLFMDPAAKVHLTSGIVPRKSIELARDWTAPALDRLLPSFRVGPVLVDPEEVRMPISNLLAGGQDWTRRGTETTWRDDPSVAATMQALLPEDAAVLEEGYIRLNPAPDEAGPG
jgi:hypothetical protein